MNQVVLLNEYTETRTTKLGLNWSECCVNMEIISSSSEQSKHKQNSLILLGKSGHVYLYDDSLIERYLLQSQSKSTASLPKEVMVRLPLSDSSISIAKFISNATDVFYSEDEVIGLRFFCYWTIVKYIYMMNRIIRLYCSITVRC